MKQEVNDLNETVDQNGQERPREAPEGRDQSRSVLPCVLSLETALDAFLRALEGKNRSQSTLRAYATDLSQFIKWLHDINCIIKIPGEVQKADITEYLSHLSRQEATGITRARKLAAIREYFRFLEQHEHIDKSPAAGVETPKKERKSRTYLRPEEYNKMLSLAGGNPRDYAILQTLLQTGIRVGELCNLRLGDIDLEGRTLRISLSKGMVARDIELEKRGILAIRNWLQVRPQTPYDHLFLNRDGEPLGERGVRKLVVRYRKLAGITRKVSCHSLRHTFATYKAERGVSPFQLQQWLGHANLNTTQIYVHMGRQNAKKMMEATAL